MYNVVDNAARSGLNSPHSLYKAVNNTAYSAALYVYTVVYRIVYSTVYNIMSSIVYCTMYGTVYRTVEPPYTAMYSILYIYNTVCRTVCQYCILYCLECCVLHTVLCISQYMPSSSSTNKNIQLRVGLRNILFRLCILF